MTKNLETLIKELATIDPPLVLNISAERGIGAHTIIQKILNKLFKNTVSTAIAGDHIFNSDLSEADCVFIDVANPMEDITKETLISLIMNRNFTTNKIKLREDVVIVLLNDDEIGEYALCHANFADYHTV